MLQRPPPGGYLRCAGRAVWCVRACWALSRGSFLMLLRRRCLRVRPPALCPDLTSQYASCFFPIAGSPPPPPPVLPCDLGQTGSQLGNCQDCPAGKYKPVVGDLACTACEPHSTTASDKSTAKTDCQCNAGYSGPNGGPCTACDTGKYRVAGGDTGCSDCPDYSLSPAASTALTDCQCNAGYSGPNGATCTVCEAGKYKMAVGSAVCSDCPADSLSPAASTAVTSCQCNKGYTGTNGGTCTACLAGKYKTQGGPGECLLCGADKYSTQVGMFDVAGCSSCPANSQSLEGSNAITKCRCNAGYSGPDGQACTACEEAKYKDSVGGTPCISCPASSNTLQTASSARVDCLCNNGYTGPNGGSCTACGMGKYKASVGPSACTNCPSHTWTEQNAKDELTDCVCNKGFIGPNGGVCTSCGPGKYKDVVGDFYCVDCGSGTFSAASGAGSGATCQQCPANQYAATASGASECLNCPAYSTAAMGTWGVSNCKCNAGYSGDDGSTCTLCEAGKFEAINTGNPYDYDNKCVDCPDHSHSLAGTYYYHANPPAGTVSGSCTCNAGYSSQGSGISLQCTYITPPPAPPRPIVVPGGGDSPGFVTVTMEVQLGHLVYTTDGSIPTCTSGTTTKAELVLTADTILSAIACREWFTTDAGGVSSSTWIKSELTSRRYTISAGPVVEVSFSIGGSVTAADMTTSVKDAFKANFATSMGE